MLPATRKDTIFLKGEPRRESSNISSSGRYGEEKIREGDCWQSEIERGGGAIREHLLKEEKLKRLQLTFYYPEKH